jgi:hypothetical protein
VRSALGSASHCKPPRTFRSRPWNQSSDPQHRITRRDKRNQSMRRRQNRSPGLKSGRRPRATAMIAHSVRRVTALTRPLPTTRSFSTLVWVYAISCKELHSWRSIMTRIFVLSVVNSIPCHRLRGITSSRPQIPKSHAADRKVTYLLPIIWRAALLLTLQKWLARE